MNWRAIFRRTDRAAEIADHYRQSHAECPHPAESLVSEYERLTDGTRRLKGFHCERCGAHLEPDAVAKTGAKDAGNSSVAA